MRRWTTLLCALAAVGLMAPAAASADFRISSFEGVTLNEDGTVDTRAGGHPFEQRFSFDVSTKETNGNVEPDGNLKDVEIDFPPGFVGDPSAAAVCSEAQFAEFDETLTSHCPDGSQVGTVELRAATGGEAVTTILMPLWNMGSQDNVPSEFGYSPLISFLHTRAYIRTGRDNGITIVTRELPQPSAIVGATVTLWGVPSDPAHDQWRKRTCFNESCFSEGAKTQWPRLPFISNPGDCSQAGLTSVLRVDSWQEPGNYATAEFTSPGPTGCGKLNFTPTFSWQADNQRAGAPSGYSFDLAVPLNRNPDGVAVPPVKKVVATLPEGVTLSPGGADGLEACTEEQVGVRNAEKSACPTSSAVGDATLDTPLLPKPMNGTIYLATPHANPFDSLFAIYLVFEGFGARVKLPGKVEVNPETGLVVSTFDNAPQLPFSNMHLHFGGGSRAVLSNPMDCGRKTMTMQIDSWGGQSVAASSSFSIDQRCDHPFQPQLDAGARNPAAGTSSPFVFRLNRGDDEQTLKTIDISLPPGQLARLRGASYCPESTLAAISPLEGTAAGERAAPSCPANSQIGTATVAGGPGPTPLYISSRVYLAGPYKGAPLSLAVVTPAISGPYDLGNVVVRSALRLDPVTLRTEAVTDPLPTIIYGVPLGLRQVWVNLDRPDFTLNPTNCRPFAVEGLIGSYEGATAPVSSPYQVGECGSLPFKPRLALRLTGPTRRGDYPQLRAVLRAREGEANIRRVSVTLPHSEFLEQAHIRTICTRVQFAADACPAASVYGYAKAFSALLDEPLQGPVYLRSSDHPLPDLVASLHGQFDVDLAGRIDTERGGIRTTFPQVPDAPVSKFVLSMKGGKKGLLVNSRNLCLGVNRAKVQLSGQNGKELTRRPKLANSCKGKR
ncbi:MAG TPA: hypothetical protein VGW80_08805 [Solirubrobacterales bacterium]|jgi:hypothetical protein|nr:hypothetical protein [Solirubrobacterales bacterium]